MVQTQLELQKLTARLPTIHGFFHRSQTSLTRLSTMPLSFQNWDILGRLQTFRNVRWYLKEFTETRYFLIFFFFFLSLFSKKKIGVGAVSFLRNNSQTWGANCSKPMFLPENLSKMEQSCRNVQLFSSLTISRESICFLEQIFHRTQLLSVPG